MIEINRVITDDEGTGQAPRRAAEKGISPEVVFLRKDGWTLGAPRQYESIAYDMWSDEWTHFSRDGKTWKPISEYFLV